MAIPVKHTIRLETVHDIQAAPTTRDHYSSMGLPPRFHIICSCQWEGWTHQQWRAESWAQGHRNAQLMRGNDVEIVSFLPPESQPTKDDASSTTLTGASSFKGLQNPTPDAEESL